VLFNDTIYYNIAYGKRARAKSDRRAARMARIHDLIAGLPMATRRRSASAGSSFRRREAARRDRRVILKEPQILIFDEATSALDTKTEREIQAASRRSRPSARR